MIIQEIIAIAGKPGLFRIVVTNRNNLIVESMLDKKRLSIPGTSRISSLADITMFTTGEDLLLMEVLNRMNEHVGDNAIPNVKGDASSTKAFVKRDHPRVGSRARLQFGLEKVGAVVWHFEDQQLFPIGKSKRRGRSNRRSGFRNC